VLPPRLRRSISPNTARFVWTLLHGRPLGDVLVLHRCGVAACVNPGHLYSGTYTDNARDARRHAALRAAAQDGAPPGGAPPAPLTLDACPSWATPTDTADGTRRGPGGGLSRAGSGDAGRPRVRLEGS